MSIRKAMDGYAASGKKRWHTPGHKGALDTLDLTEIDCKNGSVFPSDEIERAQIKGAEFFGAKYCRFLVGGSSSGIKAAIMSVGGDIIAPINRHRCVDEGASLARCRVFSARHERAKDGLYAPLTLKETERAMDEYPSAKAVVLLSPDYYGRTAAGEIAELVRGRGKILIADSAHGAHFSSRRDLFGDGFSGKADICVMSAHKTMRAYTQASYLCCNDEGLMRAVDGNLALLGTTSPSYLLLSSLEDAVDYERENASRYDKLKAAIDGLRECVCCLRSDDFMRITVDAAQYGMSGKQLFEALFDRGQVAEMYDDRYVVFIAALSDSARDVEELKNSILYAVKAETAKSHEKDTEVIR